MEHHRYSIFIIHNRIEFDNNTYTEGAIEYVDTFNTLVEAKEAEKEYEKYSISLKPIIIPTY